MKQVVTQMRVHIGHWERGDKSMVKEIEVDKTIGQFRLALNGVMTPFSGKVNYGLAVHVPQVIDEIVKLALKLHDRLNGKDIPII